MALSRGASGTSAGISARVSPLSSADLPESFRKVAAARSMGSKASVMALISVGAGGSSLTCGMSSCGAGGNISAAWMIRGFRFRAGAFRFPAGGASGRTPSSRHLSNCLRAVFRVQPHWRPSAETLMSSGAIPLICSRASAMDTGGPGGTSCRAMRITKRTSSHEHRSVSTRRQFTSPNDNFSSDPIQQFGATAARWPHRWPLNWPLCWPQPLSCWPQCWPRCLPFRLALYVAPAGHLVVAHLIAVKAHGEGVAESRKDYRRQESLLAGRCDQSSDVVHLGRRRRHRRKRRGGGHD